MRAMSLTLKALSRRERILLAGGGAAVIAFIAYMMLRPGAEAPAEEDILVLSPPSAVAPPLPAPPPVAQPVASASVDGLMLQGVMGGGPGGGAAIIAFPDGSHRLVRVGREFLPGVTLSEVGLRHVVLATAGGAMRLEFNKAAVSAGGAATPAAAGSEGGEEARRQRETLEFRTGLAPRKENGRIIGFAVRPGARLGLLQRAGLQPGDVIVAVNGQAFESEEKVLELSGELAGSYEAEIDYLRGGKPMKASIAVNPRPAQ